MKSVCVNQAEAHGKHDGVLFGGRWKHQFCEGGLMVVRSSQAALVNMDRECDSAYSLLSNTKDSYPKSSLVLHDFRC